MKKSRVKWPLIKKLRIFFLFATASLLCLLLAAGITDENDMELRLMGIHDSRFAVLLEDSGKVFAYYKDLSDPDSHLTRAQSVPESGCTFFFDDGTLGVADIFDGEFDVNIYPFDTGLEYDDDRCPFDFSPSEGDKLVFSNTDINEYIMYILSADGTLRACEAMCEPEEDALLSGVDFLESTQGGWVYAYAGETLRRWIGSDFDMCEEYPGAPCPDRLVGESVYIDEVGSLVRLNGGVAVTVDIDKDSLNANACFGTDEYIIAADNSGTVHKYDLSEEQAVKSGTAEIDGRILGIIEDNVLVKKDGQIYLERLIFHDPDDEPGEEVDPPPTPTPVPDESGEPSSSPYPDDTATPTPGPDDGSSEPSEAEPTPTPIPTPFPADKNDEVGKLIEEIKFKELPGENGRYASMAAGARVSDLRKIYWPQSIEAFTQNDEPVFESILKTGMKVHLPLEDGNYEEIPIIIRGDCDGDGRVRESDITFASLYIINVVYAETDVQFMSMDMNGDGVVTIWDLPLIVDEIEVIK